MDNLVLKEEGYEVVLTDDFDGMWERLVGAHRISKFAACATQLYSSWIVFNALWADSVDDYYVDSGNGDIYDEFTIAPKEVQPRLMLRHKRSFPSQTDFFRYLENEIPDFNLSTFWSRHNTILKRIEVWRKAHSNISSMPEDVFLDIVQDVVLYGKRIDDVIINGTFEITPAKRGVPAEIVALSESADMGKLGIEEENKSEEELLQEVAVTVLEKIDDAHDQVRAGASVYTVVQDIKNELLNKATIYFFVKDLKLHLHYAPASNGDIIPAKRYLILFVDQNGEIVELANMDGEVRDWLESHLRLTIHGWRQSSE